MTRHTLSLGLAALCATLAALPAAASTSFYTSAATWQAAADPGAANTTSFNLNGYGINPGLYPAVSNAGGLTIDGVNFVSTTGNGGYWLGLAQPYACCNDYNNPNVSLQAAAPSSGYYGITNGVTTITLPTGTTAFAFDAFTVQAGDYSGSGHDTLTLTVAGSTGTTVTQPNAVTGFLGFVSSTPITSITVTGMTREDFIDFIDGSFVTGVTSAVPETSSWALMVLGVGLIGAGARKSRRSVSA